MTDLIGLGAIGILGFVCGSLVALFAIWRLETTHLIETTLENLLNDFATDEELQKTLYTVGGILGQGVKAGVGLNVGRSGGKLKLNDLILDLAGQFFQGQISKTSASPSPLPSPSPPTPNQTRDKFFNNT